MATREENLKKINAELEKLNDAELEQVAGGTMEEVDEDIRRFKKLNIPIDEGHGHASWVAQDILTGSLVGEFKAHGVDYIRSWINPNQYYIGGKKVTQDEAWKHIEAQHKK